ncbi:MAG: hypothetical protein WD600_11105, partial [Pseudohongiella sp.]
MAQPRDIPAPIIAPEPAPETPADAGSYNVNIGLDAFRAEDYDAALQNFTEGAMIGHAIAQYNLALMYQHGNATQQKYQR